MKKLLFSIFQAVLKMQGLYLDSLIISHKYCSMIGILRRLTLQKGIAINVKNVFGPKTLNKK